MSSTEVPSAIPAPEPATTRPRKVAPADAYVIAGIIAGGIALDLVHLAESPITVAGAAFFAVIAAAMLLSRRVQKRHAFALLAAVPLFSAWLSLRVSPWVVILDLAAVLLLLALASMYSRTGSIFDMSVPRLLGRVSTLAWDGFCSPGFAFSPLSGKRMGKLGAAAPVIRGLAIIAPVILVLGLLLTSSDAVFASIFDVEIDLENVPAHLFFLAFGGWIAATLLMTASRNVVPEPGISPFNKGATESIVALSALVLLFGAFCITQAVVLLGGADEILKTQGLTYAEHAREGFFQLLAVAVITLATLMTLHVFARTGSAQQQRIFVGLAEVAIALTIVIVAVAVQRLDMYEDAYGLTMLRLYSTIFAWFLGAVFILLGLFMAGVGRNNAWFVGASTVTGLVTLLAVNIVNPAAYVVDRNVSRIGSTTVPFDASYVANLGYDAYPSLEEALPRLDQASRDEVESYICSLEKPDTSSGWKAWNRSESEASDVYRRLCADYLPTVGMPKTGGSR